MNNLAQKRALASAVNEHGLVVAANEEMFVIQTNDGRVTAARAVSCLVEPLAGDLVLVSHGAAGKSYILAVLEREGDGDAALRFPGNISIRSDNGRINLTAKQGLDLVSEEELGLAAPKLNAAAGEGDFYIDRASFFGSFLMGRFQTVRLISEALESFCQRLTSLAKHAYRRVEETDQVKCGRLDYQAESLLQMGGEYAKLHAEEDVHINAERINLG